MEKRVDVREGRFAINDKLSWGVNKVKDDEQKFKDETKFEFTQHEHGRVEGLEGGSCRLRGPFDP